MSRIPVQLSVGGGLNTSSAFESQPEGTSRDLLNVRDHDPAANVDRLCQRPGLTRYADGSTLPGSAIRAISGGVVTISGETLSAGDTTAVEDTFGGVATAAGDLGDRVSPIGEADYEIFQCGVDVIVGDVGDPATWNLTRTRWDEYTDPVGQNRANEFGWAVDTHGDYMVVGFPDYRDAGLGSVRHAAVYRKQAGGWSFQNYLDSSTDLNGGRIGSAVAVTQSTDGLRAALGGHLATDFSAIVGGIVRFYGEVPTGSGVLGDVDGAGFVLATATANSPGGVPQDAGFGFSVAMSGDWLVVGAPNDVSEVTGAGPYTDVFGGQVYVFSRSGTGYTLSQKLAPTGLATGDRFGFSVAVDGDYLVVGAPGSEQGGNARAGEVYFFKQSAGTWSQETGSPGIQSTPGAYSVFGYAVDVDGAAGRAAVKAYAGYESWSESSGTWSREATKARPSGTYPPTPTSSTLGDSPGSTDWFGLQSSSIVVDGDRMYAGEFCTGTTNAGGWNPGTGGTVGSGHAAGRAHIFDWNAGTSAWDDNDALDPFGTTQDNDDQYFGRSLAVDDYTLIGAPGEKSTPVQTNLSGAVYEATLQPGAPTGPNVDGSGYAVDGRSATSTVVPSGFACFLETDIAIPHPNYTLQLEFSTNSVSTGRYGFVGVVTEALTANLGSTTDDSSIFVIGNDLENDGTVSRWATVNGAGDMEGVTDFNDDLEWKAGTDYTMTVLVKGVRAEVWLQEDGEPAAKLRTIENITAADPGGGSGSRGVGAESTGLGFLLGYCGDDGDGCFFRGVDAFRVRDLAVSGSDRTGPGVVVVSAGDVYIGDEQGMTLAAGGTDVLDDARDTCAVAGPQSAIGGGDASVYLLDGRNYRRVSLRDQEVEDWVPTSGSLPFDNDAGAGARYAVAWQGRAVLFGYDPFPENFYMSRRGDWLNFNYTPSTPSILQAVAGNLANTGLPTVPISACAPIGQQFLAIAGDTQLWILDGDPADQGRLRSVSDTVGIVGPYAWAKDPQGNTYFVAYDGLYVWPNGSLAPQPISVGRIDSFFDSIDHDTDIVRLQWSHLEDGLYIFVDGESASREHMFLRRTTGAFYPTRISSEIPVTAAGSYADVSQQGGRRFLLGHLDGNVREFEPGAYTDDQRFIESHARYAPIINGSTGNVMVEELEIKLAESTRGAKWSMERSASAEMQNATVTASGPLRAGSTTQRVLRRVMSPAVRVSFESSEVGGWWGVEQARAMVAPAGRARR